MKSIKYLVAAALALLAVGCNKESVTEVPDGQMVDVTFTAALPGEELATKAIGDGQTAKKLYVAVYENDDAKTKLDLNQEKTFTDLKTTVTFSLVKGKTYNFVFWAQAENGAPYSWENDDLKNIKISYDNALANDETRDAFYATRKELKVNGALTETIKLYRPFAQVNFGTADYTEAVVAGLKPTKSVFSATSVATEFDTFEAEGKAEADVTFKEAALPGETLVTKEGNYTWMTMNYIIPAGKQGEKHISNVAAEFIADAGSVKVSAPQAPVQNNYRTNILGNLLTSQVIFNVEIVPIFNEPDNDIDLVNIKNVESLKALFATGGSAKLAEDLVIDETVSVPAGAEVTLDLNGKTIRNTEDLWDVATNCWSLISVKGGTLTIKGQGSVTAKENDCYAVDVQDGGNVIVEGGEYVGNIHAVYVHDGTAEIRGGKYSVQQKYPDASKADEFVLNCLDGNHANGTAKIIVSGGEFVSFNPADCQAEGAHTNFLASGYKSVQKGDNYVVVPANQTTVYTEAELDEAIAAVEKGVKSEILIAAGTYKNVIDVRSDKVITFKPAVEGASVVLGGVNGASNGTETSCVFEDITFDNSIQEAGWFVGTAQNIFPCVGVWGGQYTFKNCKFIVDGNSGKETGVMTWWTIKDCKTALTFDGCTFEGKDNHAEARAMQIYGHVDLAVLNCKLATAKRYAIKYAANEGYTANIKNCEVSNCEYTVELGSADYPGSKYTVNFENNTLAGGIADYKIAHEEGAAINGGVAKN